MSDYLIYTLRPNNTALWLPSKLCRALRIAKGEGLTLEQFNDPRVKDLVTRRQQSKSNPPIE